MDRTLLYASSDWSHSAPYQTDIQLLDNLSNYDMITVIMSTRNDINGGLWYVNFDVPLCLEFNRVSTTLWHRRDIHLHFTDTTFQIAYKNVVDESSSCIAEVYKIYGYKF